MSWTAQDAVQLIAVAVFVFWEPYAFGKRMRDWYERERVNMPAFPTQLPAWVFPLVWYPLKCSVVGATVTFFHFARVDHWVWPAAFALMFANLALAKTWTGLFKAHAFGAALAVACTLFVTALAVLILWLVARDDGAGGLWWVPMLLWIPYTAWLAIACLLSFSLMRRPRHATMLEPLAPHDATPHAVVPQPAGVPDTVIALSRLKGRIHHQPAIKGQ